MTTRFLVRPIWHPEFTLIGEVPVKGDMLRVKIARRPEELGQFTVEVYQVTAVHREYVTDSTRPNWHGGHVENFVTVHVNHIESALE